MMVNQQGQQKSFCPKCGTEIPPGQNACPNCGLMRQLTSGQVGKRLGLIRAFMHGFFPILVSILFVVSILGVFFMCFAMASNPYLPMPAGSSFLILIMSLIGVFMAFGVIYILLDIRDGIERLNARVKK